ncbi:Uncharacterised protein [Mycobacteroides abscessus subsp. abscessus]|nr:Uncharacterised protein [Mycobacteroides abscessus subsp. abscessus]
MAGAAAAEETFAMSPTADRVPKVAAVAAGAAAAAAGAASVAPAGTAAAALFSRRPPRPVIRPPSPASSTRLGRLRPGRPRDSGTATVASGGCMLDRLIGGKPPRLQSSPQSRPLSLLRAVLPVWPADELEVELETVLLLAVPRSPDGVVADSLFLLACCVCVGCAGSVPGLPGVPGFDGPGDAKAMPAPKNATAIAVAEAVAPLAEYLKVMRRESSLCDPRILCPNARDVTVN